MSRYEYQINKSNEGRTEYCLHQLLQHRIPVLAVNNPFILDSLVGPRIVLQTECTSRTSQHTMGLSNQQRSTSKTYFSRSVNEHRDALFLTDAGLHRLLLSSRYPKPSNQRNFVTITSVVGINELLNGNSMQIMVHPILRGITPMILQWSYRSIPYNHTTRDDYQTILLAQSHESFLRPRNQSQLLNNYIIRQLHVWDAPCSSQ